MFQVITLAMPFFGVILIGFISGKIARIPRSGLAWLDFYLLYVALPALFFDLISKTPIEELARPGYIVATTASTFTAFVISYAVSGFLGERDTRIGTIRALVGSYANVGYMGIGLTLATLGPTASAPVALVFCFDVALVFTIVPVMMTIGGKDGRGIGGTLVLVLRRVFLHPFILATILGAAAAALHLETPAPLSATLLFLRNSAAPAALFAIGVTVALQPAGRGAPEIPALLFIKLIVHPVIAWLFVTTAGDFEPVWVQAAVIMAALPPATTIFIAAQQYDTYVNRAATAILIGTAVSVFTVTGVLYLVTNDLIPM